MKMELRSNKFDEYYYLDIHTKLRQQFSRKNGLPLPEDHIIRFPIVFSWFSFYRYTKEEAWHILRKLKDRELIEIRRFKGVVLK